MSDEQIKIAANSVAGLMDATGCQLFEIFELLEGDLVSEEDCDRIRDYIAGV